MSALPLLSGAPPRKSSDTCRQCSKKFNLLLNRARSCGHCGFSYCQDHTAHRALTPRPPDSFSLRSGSGSGYEEEHVCDFCINFVKITSLDYDKLEALPIRELKAYISAYNITIPLGLYEKSEYVNLVFRSRTQNGCLPVRSEAFFRDKTVPPPPAEGPPSSNPFSNFLSDFTDSTSSSSSRRPSNPSPSDRPPAARASPPPNHPSPRRTSAHPPANGSTSRPNATSSSNRTPPSSNPAPARTTNGARPTPPPPRPIPVPTAPTPRAQPARAQPSRPQPPPARPPPAPTPAPTPPAASTRPPTLAELILLQSQSSSANSILPDLSVRILKSILTTHHVRSDGILEKSELVDKVARLVASEGERLARMEAEERREALVAAASGAGVGVGAGAGGVTEEEGEWEAVPQWVLDEGNQQAERERERERDRDAEVTTNGGTSTEGTREEETERQQVVEKSKESAPKPKPPPPPPPAPAAERSGLCVICCDRDAILANVDCGHLALCSECADIVMAGNRECPMCRSVMRPAGLLRIFIS